MIDNFDLITPLLNFKSKDDFYFIQVLQRKKDHKKGKVNGTNNNSRLIKAYYIDSLEHLEFVKPEIIEMCKLFNARAGINLNKRSFRRTHMELLKKVVAQMENGSYSKGAKAYPSVAGAMSPKEDKMWILDIDYPVTDDRLDPIPLSKDTYIRSVFETYLDTLQPAGDKIIAEIPSKNGKHFITRPFDLYKFKQEYPDIEVHKNNPTNLYIP